MQEKKMEMEKRYCGLFGIKLAIFHQKNKTIDKSKNQMSFGYEFFHLLHLAMHERMNRLFFEISKY
jgi:hypothetical protein